MRKKLLFLLFLVILSPLSASTLRVGLYVSGNEGLKSAAVDALSLIVPALSEESALVSANKARDSFTEEAAYQKSVHEAYAADKDIPLKEEALYESSSEYEIIQIEVPEGTDSFLSLRDEAALRHLSLENNLDALICVLSSEYGFLIDYESFIYMLDEVYECRKTMVMSSNLEEEFFPLSMSLATILDDSLGFIRLSDYPSASRFYVDGRQLSALNGVLAVEGGVHEIRVQAEGYHDILEEVTLLPSEAFSLSAAAMEKVYLPPIAFTSTPSDAKLSFSGADPVALPLIEENLQSPLVLTAQRDGFLPLSLQLTEAEGVYGMQLKPEWMGSDNRLEEAKKDFYASLRNTFLSIGAAAASQALTSIYSEELGPYKTGVNVITTGVSVVSLISLIKNLADYYNVAKQTYLEEM